MSKTKILAALALATGLVAGAAPAFADAKFTPWGQVNELQAGWVVDRMLVFHGTGALTNDGCTVLNNGYIIKETDPARKNFYAMLLSAKMNQREVAMVISGCFEGRPRVVSVVVR